MNKLTTIVLGGLVVAGPAVADSGKDMKAGEVFKKLDINGDQVLSEQEASGHADLSAQFAEVDKNGDGYVTVAEFKSFAEEGKRKERDSYDPQ